MSAEDNRQTAIKYFELAKARPLFIVSNCQSGYIETFLQRSGLSSIFKDSECWGNTGLSKSENLRRIIERNDLRRPVFVGDTDSDARAANDCGIPFVFVTYGFGEQVASDFEVGSFAELVRYLS